MKQTVLYVLMTAVLAAADAAAIDWPVTLNFQLGFHVQVLPGAQDTSQQRGLAVITDKVITDKSHFVTITGTIVNFGSDPQNGIEMQFAVTSYLGSGVSLGRASVEPASLSPGGTASFTARISLDSERPRHALYTVTAASPVLCPQPAPAETPAAEDADT